MGRSQEVGEIPGGSGEIPGGSGVGRSQGWGDPRR